MSAIFASLEGAPARGETAIGRLLPRVAELMPARSLVAVISDLIDDASSVLRGLAAVRERRSEAVVFHVMDPGELDLPFPGWTLFRDPESPARTVRLDARRVRAVYRENLERHRAALRRGCESASVDYVWATTDMPFVELLASYLHMRRRGT
jgi:uncharacterized protein (DUF58 family)